MDVEGEIEESTGLLNHISTLNMHKMRFTNIGNNWLVEGDHGANIDVGANDHEAVVLFLLLTATSAPIHKAAEAIDYTTPSHSSLLYVKKKRVIPISSQK